MAPWKQNDWLDGHYEIFMDFDGPYGWIEAAQTLWAQPQLNGVWMGREFDPASDPRLDAGDIVVTCELMTQHLNGVAHLPNGTTAPCGSAISGRHNWLIFFLPIAGLGRCYDLGRYPFADTGRPWVFELDRWLVDLATAVYRRVPFRVAAIGSELHTLSMLEQPEAAASASRPCGLLLPSGDDLCWLPPTFAPQS